jgi:DNA polymerase-3 subunit epsilon
MACILESTEIKKLWPIFNASQKRWEDVYGIFVYEDQNGYHRLAIDKNRKGLQPVTTFHYLVDGHAIIRKLIREFDLCPKLCFMQKDEGECEGIRLNHCKGACEKKEPADIYNARVSAATASVKAKPSFAIVDKGLNAENRSCVLIWEGDFYGMGYIPQEVQISDPSGLKEYLTVYRENSFIRNLVHAYAARNPGKVMHFESVA